MKTALLPISGKPLHLGHWRLIMIAAEECDKAIVFTSDTDRQRGKDEAEIKGTTAVKVWRSHFLPLMKKEADNVEVRFVDNPMQSVHEMLAEEAKAPKQTAPLFVIYSDDTDIDENWKPGELKKSYPKLSIQRRGVGRSQTDDVSGTEMRRWLRAGEAEKFMKHLPPVSAEDKKAIWNIYRTEDKMTRDPMKEAFDAKLREMMSNRVHELDNKKLYERVWRKVSLMDAKRFEALSKKIYGEKKTVKDVVDALHYSLTEKTDYVKPFDNDGFKAELEKFSEMIKDVDKEETKKAHEEIAAEIEKKGEENKEGVEAKLDDKKKVNESRKTLKEGTWKYDMIAAQRIRRELEWMKKECYDIVGDDLFMDGLDQAIRRIDELKETYEMMKKDPAPEKPIV